MSEKSIQASVSGLFSGFCGRGKAMEYQELARLSDLASAQVYEYANGKYLGSAVALVQLCRQSPEAFAAFKAMVGRGAQQSHGCEFALNREVAAAGMTFAEALADGRVDHRERVGIVNAIRRLKARAGLYLQAHAQRAA